MPHLKPQFVGICVGGADWPGVVKASHRTAPGRSGATTFWCVHRDSDVLVIDTDPERPGRLAMQHLDSDFLVRVIRERVGDGQVVGLA